MRRPGPRRRSVISIFAACVAFGATSAFISAGTASAATIDEVAASAVTGAKATATATLQIIEPSVSVQRAGKTTFKPGKEGQKLRVGDTVQTDAAGFAQVNYTDDSFTRLDVNTTFTIVSLTDDEGDRQIKGSVESGQTWNRTSALTESESFEQEGAGATAAVTGTAFLVSCSSPTTCTFTSVVDGITLTTVDGEIQHLDPLMECNSDEVVADEDANLCGAPVQVTLDAILANAFILENLFIDAVMGFEGVVEVQGEVVTVTTNDPPNDDTPPPAGPTGPTGPTGPQPVCGTPVTDPAIHFYGAPDTDPPPSTLGGCDMTAFADDTRAQFTDVDEVTAPSGGNIEFDTLLEIRDVSDSWATWSHGYTGDVYYTQGATSVTITLPAGTLAFSFYAEPNSFDPGINITATANSGVTSGPIEVAGSAGAAYFGFYTTSSDAPLTSITITCDGGDFAIGEFMISNPNPAPVFLTAETPAVVPEPQATVPEEPTPSDPPPDDPPAPEAAPQDAPAAS